MYGLNPDLKIEGMLGHTLNQICVGKFDVQFHFSSSTLVAVQGCVRLIADGLLAATWNEDTGWSHPSFQKPLNLDVTSYSIVDSKTLRIDFGDSLVLELLDDSDDYETMQIYPNGKNDSSIVV